MQTTAWEALVETGVQARRGGGWRSCGHEGSILNYLLDLLRKMSSLASCHLFGREAGRPIMRRLLVRESGCG